MAVTIDGSAGVTTNAGGSVNPSTNIAGINFSCRAWVNFNGTGTVAIQANGNVSSITDNGVGDYTVNFTTAMTDANYNIQSTCRESAGLANFISVSNGTAPTTSLCRFRASDANGTATDVTTVYIACIR
jgi:hypothetical protein